MEPIRVKGLPQLKRQLKTMVGDVSDLTNAHAAAAAFVAAAAAARAPRRTGRLASKVKGNRAQSRASISVPYVKYAGPIHWGWAARHIDAQPFISAAAQDTEPLWLPLYERDIGKAVDKVRGATF